MKQKADSDKRNRGKVRRGRRRTEAENVYFKEVAGSGKFRRGFKECGVSGGGVLRIKQIKCYCNVVKKNA